MKTSYIRRRYGLLKEKDLEFRKGYYLLRNIIYIAGLYTILSIVEPIYKGHYEQVIISIIQFVIFFFIHQTIMNGNYTTRLLYLIYINGFLVYLVVSLIFIILGIGSIGNISNLFVNINSSISIRSFQFVDSILLFLFILLAIYSEIVFFFNKNVEVYLNEIKTIDKNYKIYLKKRLSKSN